MDLIKPGIFRNHGEISAAFSLPNRRNHPEEQEKTGIDFGLNTASSEKEIFKNLEKLGHSAGADFSGIALARQIHGSNIKTVSAAGVYDDIDGYVTTTAGLALGIQVADCAAVLIADPENAVIGAFHAGWRGAVAGIVPKGIGWMVEKNANPGQMLMYISPCISLKNFEVGPEVAEQFPREFCDYSSYKKPHVDLKGFIKHQAVISGVPADKIEVSADCTIENENYFSFRRERERAGRMLGVIMLNKK